MAVDWQTQQADRHSDTVFGAWRLSRDASLRCPDGARVQLPPRLATLLDILARNPGVAVSRPDLIERCWPDVSIGEESLSRAMADLRKIFRAHGEDLVETVYGLGYRLNVARPESQPQETKAFCQEAWLRVYQRRMATLESAEDLFNRVIAREADYVPAWLGLAEAQIHRMQLGYSTTLESAPRAHQALDQALALDSALADALALKGILLTWAEWDFDAAGDCLRKSLRLDSDGYRSNQAMGWHQLALGEFVSAESHFRIATAAKPSSMTSRAGQAFCRSFQGDADLALALAREMHHIDAYGSISSGLAAIFEAALGEPGESVAMAERGFAQLPESPAAGAILAYALARDQDGEKARSVLASRTPAGLSIGAHTLASLAWLELREPELALSALEAGFAQRCTWLLPMLWDPRFEALDLEPLRKDVFCESRRVGTAREQRSKPAPPSPSEGQE